jgi:hypothetical protein
MGAASVTINTAPVGSQELIDIMVYKAETVSYSELNSLANNTESASLIYNNASGKTYATVDVRLGAISPTGTPTIQLISGSTGYEMSISTTANVLRAVRFVDIPATFLSSFTVKNNSGVALASSGNFVTITPQY